MRRRLREDCPAKVSAGAESGLAGRHLKTTSERPQTGPDAPVTSKMRGRALWYSESDICNEGGTAYRILRPLQSKTDCRGFFMCSPMRGDLYQ